jgi:predicted dehydrogenase
VRNNVLERVEAVRKTGYADEIVIEDYLGQKIDDIQRYDVDIFAIGSDWEGKFDYLNEYCNVVYLPRTEGISSTMLREKDQDIVRMGIIGSGRIAKRFIPESKVVSGVDVASVYNPNQKEAKEFASEYNISGYSDSLNIFLDCVDAVYIASPHHTHYAYAKAALKAGKHVLCEVPITLTEAESKELYNLAENNNLVLLEACKTAFCPSFNHLVTLVKSGVIGDVVDVKSSLSKMVVAPSRELDSVQCGGAINEHASITLLPIIKILGLDYSTFDFYSKVENGVDVYTKVVLNYPHATASATLGIGVKTEGNLVVSGTKGYIYVPAPWWLTSFFEVRYEDQTKNKKYFYSYDGDGLRYEIQEFISMIVNQRKSSYKLRRRESLAISRVIENFHKKENYFEL